jgi:outer membrane immunogenic protein
MVRNYWKGFGLLATVLAGTGAAGAADLAPVYTKAPPVFISDWAGFYLGINGGGGWGETKFDPPFNGFLFGEKNKISGGLFGGHAGYNWQYGSVVTGLEVDFDGADIKGTNGSPAFFIFPAGTFQRTVKFDELATARARLGYTVLPNWLVYGTAGAAWGHSSDTFAIPVIGFSTTANANNFGWTAGAGVEYKFYNNWILRAEYLHYDFAKTAYSFPAFIAPNASTTIDVVRGGLSYKF